MINDDIYSALATALGSTVEGIYDTKLPDGYALGPLPAVVFAAVSDVPDDIGIDGQVLCSTARWQVTARALDLPTCRPVLAVIKTTLHGYSGGAVVRCDWESDGPEVFEPDVIPFEYHASADFMIQH